MKILTKDLIGPELDWAVAKCEGELYPRGCVRLHYGRLFTIDPGDSETSDAWRKYDPSTDWAQGGQLRDKYDVGIEHGVPDGIPYAYLPGRYLDGSRGETALIALCRAIVAAKLGEVVQIPTELAGVHR